MDRIDGVTEDRGFVEKMDGVVQAGDWSESGGVCKSSGGPSLLSSSDPVEARGDEGVIRVGTIGCSISVASGLSESLLSVDGLPSLSSRRDAVFRSETFWRARLVRLNFE